MGDVLDDVFATVNVLLDGIADLDGDKDDKKASKKEDDDVDVEIVEEEKKSE